MTAVCQIQSDQLFEIGKGWYPLVDYINSQFMLTNAVGTISQVKEKMGELRVYVSLDRDLIEDMVGDTLQHTIHEVTRFSRVVCEECAQPGYVDSPGFWLKTFCAYHHAETFRLMLTQPTRLMCPDCQGDRSLKLRHAHEAAFQIPERQSSRWFKGKVHFVSPSWWCPKCQVETQDPNHTERWRKALQGLVQYYMHPMRTMIALPKPTCEL